MSLIAWKAEPNKKQLIVDDFAGKGLCFGPNMATFGGRAVRADTSDKQTKSHFISPQKIRELLNEGVVSEQSGSNR